jgi:DSF synthase
VKPSDTVPVWLTMAPEGRPCMSEGVLNDLVDFRFSIAETFKQTPFKHVVLHSEIPGVFNLGGDLNLFLECIQAGDVRRLERYAEDCIAALYAHYSGYGLPIRTISLVQGRALGGGFEAALSSDVIIAEEDATFCFPECKFGMFPGMGGYALLCERTTPRIAETLVTSGEVYTAAQMRSMGIVDKLVDNLTGLDAVDEYIWENRKNERALIYGRSIARKLRRITFEHLQDSIRLWVDAAFATTKLDRRLMSSLVAAQEKLGTPRGITSGDPVQQDLSTAA